MSRVFILFSLIDYKSSESKHHDLLVLRSNVRRQLSRILIDSSWPVTDGGLHCRLLPQNWSQSWQWVRADQHRANGSCAQPSPLWNNLPCGIFAQWDGKRKKIEAQENLQKKKILFCHIPPESRLRYFLFLSWNYQKFPIRTHHILTWNVCFCLSSTHLLGRKMMVTVNFQ